MKMDNSHMIGLFDKIPATIENMNAIAQFNRIIMNYLKMKQIENEKITSNGVKNR